MAASFGIGRDLADNTFVLLLLGCAWAAGVLVARRTDDLGALELRRLEATRAGAAEERHRIARELHDVVAHRVSMMVVQSQLADAVLEKDPARRRRAIVAVEAAGREALVELRSVLGLMHHDDPATLAPGDTELSRLGDVVEEARAGGLPVTLETTGPVRSRATRGRAGRLPHRPGVADQRRTARGSAPTRVRLDYLPGAVESASRTRARAQPGCSRATVSPA